MSEYYTLSLILFIERGVRVENKVCYIGLMKLDVKVLDYLGLSRNHKKRKRLNITNPIKFDLISQLFSFPLEKLR